MKELLTKKNIIIASAVLVLVVGIILIIVLNKNKDVEAKPQSIYKEIIVDGLSFHDAAIVEENGLYTYAVKVKNNNKSDYKLQYFIFKFYDKNNKEIASLVGYVGDVVKKGDETTVTSNVDIDIRDAKKVEISIIK